MKAVIAVDIGTTSLRATVYDENGRVLHSAQRHNPPEVLDDGRVEQDPRSWQAQVRAVLRSAGQAVQDQRVQAGVAGQDLPAAAGSGVALEDALDVRTQAAKHGR